MMMQRKFNMVNEMHIMKRKTKVMKKKMELAYRVAEYPPTVRHSRSKNSRTLFSPTAFRL
jgi:hypothetical protein